MQTEQPSVRGTKAEQRARVGRPQTRFFCDFRCCILLFIVIPVIYKYTNRLNRC